MAQPEANFSDLLAGKVQREGRSNLANPWTKLLLCLIPALSGFILFRIAGVRYLSLNVDTKQEAATLTPFLLIAIGTWFAQSLDFRPRYLGRTILFAIIAFLAVALVLLNTFGALPLTAITQLPVIGPVAVFVGGITTSRSLLVITLLTLAARGFLRIYPTDAIVISSLLYWKPLMAFYQALVLLYYVIENSISRRFSAAKDALVTKYRLMHATRLWVHCLIPAALVFLKRLVLEFQDLARLCKTVLADRGWYNRQFLHEVAHGWNLEDFFAVIVIVIFGAMVSIVTTIYSLR